MREIKFRCWDEKTKEMIQMNYLSLQSSTAYTNKADADNDGYFPNKIGFKHVMQYTGLKDKNDVEIYEKDILITDSGLIWEVRWDYECLSMLESQIKNFSDKRKWYVQGNLYQNPELIKE